MSGAQDEDEHGVGAAAASAAASAEAARFPGQKTVGSKVAAFNEASAWAEGMSLREMLCSVHKVSAIVPDKLLSRKMDVDAEADPRQLELDAGPERLQLNPQPLQPPRHAPKAEFRGVRERLPGGRLPQLEPLHRAALGARQQLTVAG